jgi:hypothetical protein
MFGHCPKAEGQPDHFIPNYGRTTAVARINGRIDLNSQTLDREVIERELIRDTIPL